MRFDEGVASNKSLNSKNHCNESSWRSFMKNKNLEETLSIKKFRQSSESTANDILSRSFNISASHYACEQWVHLRETENHKGIIS